MKRNVLIGKTLGAALFAVSLSIAGSQSVDNARVTGVYCSIQYNCSAYFDKDLVVTGTGGKCATATGVDARRFQFDGGSSTGKSMLAILLSAQATQTPVYADGTGACTIYAPVENLNTIFIHN